jgi:hypothetical protein
MPSLHTTARGKSIDMAKLKIQNAYKPTLGNANQNVRGDLITKSGVVLKTQEQIQEERAAIKRQHDTVNKKGDIKDNTLLPDTINKRPKRLINTEDKHFDQIQPTLTAEHVNEPPVERPVAKHRKIVETDK